jgi:ketosteroid isomerase-like protein
MIACACSTYFSPPPQKTPNPAPQQTPKAQAAAPPAPAPPAAATNNLESTRRALLGIDLAFSRACEEKGAPEAFYQFMALDGVCLLAGEPPIEGRDAIKVHFAASPIESISWKPRAWEASSDSDLGYTWGTYELRTSAQDRASSSGKYVLVWKKQPEGTWKAVLFITSQGPITPQRS